MINRLDNIGEAGWIFGRFVCRTYDGYGYNPVHYLSEVDKSVVDMVHDNLMFEIFNNISPHRVIVNDILSLI